MCKKIKGSFSLEASFIMPIILFIYLLIILAALFLYCRCAISQDAFLLCMRAEKFTYGESDYGEVIYGEENITWCPENYVTKRIQYRRSTYPGYPTEGSICQVTKDDAFLQVKQKGVNELIVKRLQRINPVELIREGRKI